MKKAVKSKEFQVPVVERIKPERGRFVPGDLVTKLNKIKNDPDNWLAVVGYSSRSSDLLYCMSYRKFDYIWERSTLTICQTTELQLVSHNAFKAYTVGKSLRGYEVTVFHSVSKHAPEHEPFSFYSTGCRSGFSYSDFCNELFEESRCKARKHQQNAQLIMMAASLHAHLAKMGIYL